MEKKKINDTNILTVNIQIVTTVILVIVGIITIFRHSFYPVLEFVMAIDLLVVAYNNYKIYQKKNLTWVYIVFAVFLIVLGILALCGVF